MGSSLSKHAGFKALHRELDALTVSEVLNRVSKDQSFLDINRVVVSEATLVNEAIESASKNPSGAVPVIGADGAIVAVLDLPLVLDYLLNLFSDATEKRLVVDNHGLSPDLQYDFPGTLGYGYGGPDGLGNRFHAFLDVREKSFVTSYANGVLRRGTSFFEHDTIGDLLRRTKTNSSSNSALIVTSSVRLLLSRWCQERTSSICIFNPAAGSTAMQFGFINEVDALHIVEKILANHDLDLNKLKIKRLGLGKNKKMHTITYSTRVMHAFKTMHDEKVSALPILGFKNPDVFESEDKMILKGEFSLHSMRNLNHDTLQLILGSVSTFLHETDKDKRVSNLEAFVLVRPSEKLVKQFSSPLSCSRRSTLKEVLTQMHVAKRTHVWCVTKKNRVKGVVSLSDIVKLLFEKA